MYALIHIETRFLDGFLFSAIGGGIFRLFVFRKLNRETPSSGA